MQATYSVSYSERGPIIELSEMADCDRLILVFVETKNAPDAKVTAVSLDGLAMQEV